MGSRRRRRSEEDALSGLPAEFKLYPNVPNPLKDGTSIGLDLPERSLVHLGVYDISGRKVASLLDALVDAGYQTVAWRVPSGQDLSNGIYFYRVDVQGLETARRYTKTMKLMLMR